MPSRKITGMSNLLARARAQPPSEDPAVLGQGGGVRDRRWGTGNGEPRSWNRRSTRRHTEAFRYPVPITTTRSEPAGRFHNHDRTAASRPTSREPTHAVLPGRHGHRRVPLGGSSHRIDRARRRLRPGGLGGVHDHVVRTQHRGLDAAARRAVVARRGAGRPDRLARPTPRRRPRHLDGTAGEAARRRAAAAGALPPGRRFRTSPLRLALRQDRGVDRRGNTRCGPHGVRGFPGDPRRPHHP
jgi:hypothetical protein